MAPIVIFLGEKAEANAERRKNCVFSSSSCRKNKVGDFSLPNTTHIFLTCERWGALKHEARSLYKRVLVLLLRIVRFSHEYGLVSKYSGKKEVIS